MPLAFPPSYNYDPNAIVGDLGTIVKRIIRRTSTSTPTGILKGVTSMRTLGVSDESLTSPDQELSEVCKQCAALLSYQIQWTTPPQPPTQHHAMPLPSCMSCTATQRSNLQGLQTPISPLSPQSRSSFSHFSPHSLRSDRSDSVFNTLLHFSKYFSPKRCPSWCDRVLMNRTAYMLATKSKPAATYSSYFQEPLLTDHNQVCLRLTLS